MEIATTVLEVDGDGAGLEGIRKDAEKRNQVIVQESEAEVVPMSGIRYERADGFRGARLG